MTCSHRALGELDRFSSDEASGLAPRCSASTPAEVPAALPPACREPVTCQGFRRLRPAGTVRAHSSAVEHSPYKRGVTGSIPVVPTRRSSRFSRSMFTFVLGSAARLSWARTRADMSRVSAETCRAIAYRASRRVGWPRLTRGRDRNRAAFAQVKAKREDLTSQNISREPPESTHERLTGGLRFGSPLAAAVREDAVHDGGTAHAST
jgi:hypothetical protein